MRHQKLPCQLALGIVLVLLTGCGKNAVNQDTIDVVEPVASSALVPNSWHPSVGFVIDKEEGLLITTNEAVGPKEEIEVVFPILNDGKALVRKSAWMAQAKEHTVKGSVLVADPERDLAIIRLDSVPDDVTELKLAKTSPAKGTAVKFLSAGLKDMLWDSATSTVAKLEAPGTALASSKKARNATIELAAADSGAAGVSGGALLNENNEVIGVVAGSAAQAGALRCIDLSELRPLLGAAYRSFAMHAYENRKYDVALKYSEQALAAWPDDALGCNERGAAYSQLDQFDKAIADYSRALELEPKMALAYRNRGSSYYHLGNYKEAVADCNRAIDLMPSYQSAYRVRRDAYAKLGMTKETTFDSQVLEELNKQTWRVTAMVGNSNYRPCPSAVESMSGLPSTSQGTAAAQGSTTPGGFWYGSRGRRYIVVGAHRPVAAGVRTTGGARVSSGGRVSGGGGGRKR